MTTIQDRYIMGVVQRRCDQVRVGDRLDLQGDPTADKGNHPEFEFEFECVEAIERENADCIVLAFESGFVCGFGTHQWIQVDPEQVRT